MISSSRGAENCSAADGFAGVVTAISRPSEAVLAPELMDFRIALFHQLSSEN
jgi:hypothetical protein